MSYRPLSEFLTVKESQIEGLGLFAVDEIYQNITLGVTHIYDVRFENNLIRTPLTTMQKSLNVIWLTKQRR